MRVTRPKAIKSRRRQSGCQLRKSIFTVILRGRGAAKQTAKIRQLKIWPASKDFTVVNKKVGQIVMGAKERAIACVFLSLCPFYGSLTIPVTSNR